MSSHGEDTLDSDDHGIISDNNKPGINKRMFMFIFFAIFSLYVLYCINSKPDVNIIRQIPKGSYFGIINDLYL